MPICIECSYPVSHLYSTYSRADDRSLGKGVRLTQCPRCQRFADKYVEYDFVVLFIDLVLIKPQVYRHLLFNRLGRDDNQFDRSIIRLGVLLLLFDVYLTWARIERSASVTSNFLSRTPIIIQYFFFLTLNALATLAHHLTVRSLSFLLVPRRAPTPAGSGKNNSNVTEQSSASHPLPTPVYPASSGQHSSVANLSTTSPSRVSRHELSLASSSTTCLPNTATSTGASATATSGVAGNHAHSPPLPPPPAPPPLRRASTAPVLNVQPLPPPAPASPTAISTALLVSSCAKLFPILLVIWGPDGSGGISSGGNNNSSHNSGISNSYTQRRATTQIGHTPSLLFAQQHGTATPVATVAQPSLQLASSSSPSSPSESLSMSSSFENWVARLVSTMPLSSPANQHLAGLLELLGSLLSLGAADTHLVLLSNIEALYILLGCGYLRAVALAVAGLIARWTVQRVVLGAVGVG